jgi:uncharacterized RDD family membrane protein YckC
MPTSKPKAITWKGHYAGYASRLLAIVIDLLIVAIIFTFLSLLYDIVFVNLSGLFQQFVGKFSQTAVDTARVSDIKAILVIWLIFITFGVYFVFFWTVIGSTVGGIIVGIRIVNNRGKNPTFWQALIRYLVEFLIPLIGLIGSIWILFSRRRRALFDRVAGTYVLYNWDARPDEKFLKEITAQIAGPESTPISETPTQPDNGSLLN